jgi:hypothetical protein
MQKEESLTEDAIITDVSDNMNNIRSVSKELFNKNNLQGKTELTCKQINGIARTRFMTRWLKNSINDETNKPYTMEENFDKLLEDLELLSISKNRKSREEFVESMKIQNAQSNKETFWNRLSGG